MPHVGVLLGDVRVAPLVPFLGRKRERCVEHGVDHVDERHVGDHGAEQLGPHVHHGAHEQAPRAPAVRHQAVAARVLEAHEFLAHVDVVPERVQLVHHFAVVVPAASHLLPAADVGDRVDEAAIHETQDVRVERRLDRRPVRAVGVEQQRAAAVERRAAPQQQRHGDPHAVPRRGHEAAHFVLTPVVAARNLLPLLEHARAAAQVVVVYRARRHERRVGEPERAGVELGVARGKNTIRDLGERHVVRAVGPEIRHAQPAQPARALAHHDEVLEGVEVLHEHRVAVRQPVGPVRGPGVRFGRPRDPEVGRVVVGIDQEKAVGGLHAVLDIGPARGDDAGLGRRRRGRDQAPLGGRKPVGRDEHVLAAARAEHRHVLEDVVLLEHLDVLRPGSFGHVPPHGVAAFGRVGRQVEERAVVIRPGGPVPHARDRVGQPTRAQVLHVQRILAERRGVLEIQEAAAVGTDVEAAQGVEALPLRQRVLIEDHVLGRVEAALLATIDRVRLPLFGAVVVPKTMVAVRHREVRLLDPAQHLAVQLLLQRLRVLHGGRRVGVLRLEVREHLRVLLVAEPEVVVLPHLAVQGIDLGNDAGGRGRLGPCEGAEREQQSETEANAYSHEGPSCQGEVPSSRTQMSR